MRRSIASALAFALVAAPLTARADAFMGCLTGPSDLNRCSISGAPAAALAAIAAPIIVAGAAVTVAHELRKRTDERLPDARATPHKKGAPTLALVPEPPDPYRTPAGAPERAAPSSAAFRFNDTATNVATAVAGAAVLGAIIATVAKRK
jgi:hypothetical protein